MHGFTRARSTSSTCPQPRKRSFDRDVVVPSVPAYGLSAAIKAADGPECHPHRTELVGGIS